ncbi:Uma2 family endonuclease [Streptomyces sp. enrichment culture]|uniref:Uma2 family endonuclease n=1 Tax=Streptomyces sp. enrichment culture TaxID=1795815 RepID=UPI003F567424
MAVDELTPAEFEDLARIAQNLDTPDGLKAEIIGGRIVLSRWADSCHVRSLARIRPALMAHAPEGHAAELLRLLFAFPGARRAYGPDLYVAEESAFDRSEGPLDAEVLSLAADHTSSSTRDDDRDEKLLVYGRTVPIYLLVNMEQRDASVFWNPSSRGYRSRHTVPFGRTLAIPEPFGFGLDTAALDTAVPGPVGGAGRAVGGRP